jgi:hypothetical protein
VRRRAAVRDEREMQQRSVSASGESRRLSCVDLTQRWGRGIRVLGRGPLIRVFLNARVRVDPFGDGR